MSKHNSLKRNKNLVVFSKEHYHGLVFCSHLKMASKATDTIVKLYISDFWYNHLQSHFKKEEELLLPIMAEGPQKNQFLKEHLLINNQIHDILEGENNITTKAIKLGETINKHIRFEERMLFPWLEETVSETELLKIGKQLEKDHAHVHCFYPEFWKF